MSLCHHILSMSKRYYAPRNSGNFISGEYEPTPKSTSSSTRSSVDLGNNQNVMNVTARPKISHGKVSSNIYANNASQNTGNVLTDRPMIRVQAPPGGFSTIQLL
jgi:hypothetical protein